MDVSDTLKRVLQEWLIPEFEKLHHELAEQRGRLDGISKRLDDINLHLADQSRRIDETNKRIDKVHDDLLGRMDALREELLDRIDAAHDRIDTANQRLDQANALIGRLYEVIVRRDEHVGLERWVRELDSRLGSLERRLAA